MFFVDEVHSLRAFFFRRLDSLKEKKLHRALSFALQTTMKRSTNGVAVRELTIFKIVKGE